MKKRVLIIHPALAPYRIDLFNSLSDKSELFLVILRDNLIAQEFNQAELKKQLHCDWRLILTGFGFKAYVFRFGLLKLIVEFKPDIVITSEFNVQTIQLALIKDSFLLRHDFKFLTLIDDSPEVAAKPRKIKKVVMGYCLSKLDGLLLGSDKVKQIYSDLHQFPAKRIAICPVLQSHTSIRQKAARSLPDALAFANEYQLYKKKLVLFVGRLSKEKNIPLLLNSFANTADAGTRLIIIGDGKTKRELAHLVQELGVGDRVIFAGRHEDSKLYAWYLLGQLLILPSLFERFGAVVNEALAVGIPVLVSEVAGAASLISRPEEGETFSPYNQQELEIKMKKWLSRISALSRENIRLKPCLQTTSLDDTTTELIRFFENL